MDEFIAEISGRGIKPGLDRVRAGLKALGDPHLRSPVILVAGTNGKGTTAKIIESMARALGHRTFLYTSPHLVRLEERYRFDGLQVEADVLRRCHQRCLRVLPDGLTEAGHLSPFEWMTLVGFVLAEERGADVWVLETGLGGRMDATNCTEPAVSVITSVGFDHMDRLGPDLASIASEKAGILRPGVPGVLGRTAVPWVEGANLLREGMEFSLEVGGAGTVAYRSGGRSVEASVPGSMSPALCTNLAVACAAIEAWSQPPEAEFAVGLRAALKSDWPGRSQVIRENPIQIVDGAHNVDGAQWLAEQLQARFPNTRFRGVMGAKADKDWIGVVGALAPVLKDLRLIGDRGGHLMDPNAMASRLRGKTHIPFSVGEASLGEILTNAVEPTLVAGSLFLVGEVFAELGLGDSLIQLD